MALIYYLDDSEADLELAENSLPSHTLEKFTSLDSLLDRIEEVKPNLILADLVIDNPYSVEHVYELSETDIPIALLTGHSDTGLIAERFGELPVVTCICKPPLEIQVNSILNTLSTV